MKAVDQLQTQIGQRLFVLVKCKLKCKCKFKTANSKVQSANSKTQIDFWISEFGVSSI